MKYKIKDGSGDRKYFTIIPNYILNHSTATAQALYLQLKRLAGETGVAYPSQLYLMKKLKISKPTVRKEVEYLLKMGWIVFIGKKKVRTGGGRQYVKSYKIVDIWQQNSGFYSTSQRGERIDLPDQRGEKIDLKGGKNRPLRGEKIDPLIRTNTKEEPVKKRKHKKYSTLSDIKKEDLQEIAEKYNVTFGFVALQFEKLQNYCVAKGRRYKNYRRALMNFVLSDVQRNIERKANDQKSGIDARGI